MVNLTYYVTDLKAYRDHLRAIGPRISARCRPALPGVRPWWRCGSLFDPDALIEIDAVAVLSGVKLWEHFDYGTATALRL